jgi:hypothetical protein
MNAINFLQDIFIKSTQQSLQLLGYIIIISQPQPIALVLAKNVLSYIASHCKSWQIVSSK